jgi:hypothetical protein
MGIEHKSPWTCDQGMMKLSQAFFSMGYDPPNYIRDGMLTKVTISINVFL